MLCSGHRSPDVYILDSSVSHAAFALCPPVQGDGQCGHSGITFDWNNASSVNACGNYIRSLMKAGRGNTALCCSRTPHALLRRPQTLLAAPSAAFVDSCKHHCAAPARAAFALSPRHACTSPRAPLPDAGGEWNAITIEGFTSSTALTTWYDEVRQSF